jgi:hypothetical protein
MAQLRSSLRVLDVAVYRTDALKAPRDHALTLHVHAHAASSAPSLLSAKFMMPAEPAERFLGQPDRL